MEKGSNSTGEEVRVTERRRVKKYMWKEKWRDRDRQRDREVENE